MDYRIAPSILAADFTRLGEEIRAAEAHGALLSSMLSSLPQASQGAHEACDSRPCLAMPLQETFQAALAAGLAGEEANSAKLGLVGAGGQAGSS